MNWLHVDRANELIAVPGALTKNGQPQVMPLFGKLIELVERRRARNEVVRKGQPVSWQVMWGSPTQTPGKSRLTVVAAAGGRADAARGEPARAKAA